MNKYRWIIFSGLALSVANMFRSVGFIYLYLISEVQPRYSFIICWTLVIFAAGGLKEKNILKNIIKQENILETPNTEEIITTLRSNESLED